MSGYIMNEDDLWGFISSMGVKTRVHGDEVQFEYCPYCHGGSKGDKWKFGVNRRSGAFGCFKGGCKKQGHFVQLCRDFGYELTDLNETKYVRFPQPDKAIVPRDPALEYLKSRGISRTTAEKYEVTTFEKRPNILWMPLFDEEGKLVGAKERRTDWKETSKFPKEKWVAGSKPVLFGIKVCVDFEYIVITEGLIDALSVSEAGIKNACSVPGGMNNDKWISLNYNWLLKFEKIIVFGDHENGSISLLKDISTRLPTKIYVVREADYLGEKDANAILKNYGADELRKCIENAVPLKVDHVVDLSEVEDEDLSVMPRVKTGVYELDRVLGGGIYYGQVCLLSGKRGEGKSTFMSQMFADALDQGINSFVYSGELRNADFKRTLNSQLAGINFMGHRINEFNEEEWYLKEDVSKRISKWYKGRAFIFDTDSIMGDDTIDLIGTIKKVVTQNAVRFVCIDNLMTAMDIIPARDDLYAAQGKFVGDLKNIARTYNIAIVLVAHQRKAGKDQMQSDSFDNDTVSGSADVTNKVDIVINYSRAKDEDQHDSNIQVGKNRLVGTLRRGENAIKMVYSPKTKRVYEERSLDKHYGWEQMGTDVTDEIDVPF